MNYALQWLFQATSYQIEKLNINVKISLFENLVAEHVMSMCSTTKLTVRIFAVFDVR